MGVSGEKGEHIRLTNTFEQHSCDSFCQVFYMRLNNECCAKGVIPLEALNDIFSNIQAIHQLHRDFLLPKLEGRMKEW